MLKTLFLIFVCYLLYKLIFEFIIPVYNASKRMKEQVSQMQQKMQEEQQRQHMAQYEHQEDYSESLARHLDNRSEY